MMMGNSFRVVAADQSSATTVDRLAQIWQRVLQRSRIEPDERLYDVGANDSLADEAFAEMARVFNRPLPTAVICHAPTIAALAVLLEQPVLPRLSPFVKLKAGSEKTPIVIAPGVGGRAMFSELAKHINTEHPIYGIQARGVDGIDEPFVRVEEMAAYYLEGLFELQPVGPYILIGYSFGGLIALEMAQRLNAVGKGVALLTLVDSYPHPRYLPLGQRPQLIAKKIERRLSDWRQHLVSVALRSTIGSPSNQLVSAGKHGSRDAAASSRLSFTKTTMRVKKCDFIAMRRYRPRFYPGKIKFVRPEFNSFLPSDPIPFWKKIAAELEVETVPGDHLGIVTTHFKGLAAALTSYLRDASETRSRV